MGFSALDAVYASIDELNAQADRLVTISKNIFKLSQMITY